MQGRRRRVEELIDLVLEHEKLRKAKDTSIVSYYIFYTNKILEVEEEMYKIAKKLKKEMKTNE
jgi:hypothetical protein